MTTKVKNQRKNQDFALDYFLSPKAMPAAGYANAENFCNKQNLMTLILTLFSIELAYPCFVTLAVV
ncbi:hypothetical protein [Nostoc sp.]|uniref:hypothetical protein n=1 Tax=Nostoc sp. TaxID=1180 RepID=UPI002FF938C6